MAVKLLPSQEVLRQLLDYDPETGFLMWRWREGVCKQWNKRWPGTQAFTRTCPRGYRSGQIFKTDYLAHRVIWKWWHGTEPDTIDHVNGDQSDNRISNLRSVPFRENCRNVPMPRNNKSGETGIRRVKNRWRVVVNTIPKAMNVGSFQTMEEAVAARDAAWADLGFHENHGRKTLI